MSRWEEKESCWFLIYFLFPLFCHFLPNFLFLSVSIQSENCFPSPSLSLFLWRKNYFLFFFSSLYHQIKDEPCQSTFLFHEFPHSFTLRFPSPLRFYFFLSYSFFHFFFFLSLSLCIVFFHFSSTINTHSSVKRLNWWLKKEERRGRMKNVKKKRKEYLEGMEARSSKSGRERKWEKTKRKRKNWRREKKESEMEFSSKNVDETKEPREIINLSPLLLLPFSSLLFSLLFLFYSSFFYFLAILFAASHNFE